MTLKTSSFKINKTIFKKTILRFWPIWALYFVIMIFTLPVNLYNSARHVHVSLTEPELIASDRLQSLLNVLDMNLLPILVAVFSIISAVAVFSYLYATRSCNMMHAFPVKRTELFATNYMAGFLFLLIPQVIIFLLTVAVCGVLAIPGIQYVAIWLLLEIGMSFFFYSLAVFCCMLTGHFFAGFAFFFLFNAFYGVFAMLLNVLAEQISYGFAGISNLADIPGGFLSPLLYLASDNRVEFDYTVPNLVVENVHIVGGSTIALYCIPAVILIALSIFLYKRRQLECAAEMTAHKFVKPMTRWLVTVAGAMGLSLWFSLVFFDGSAFFLVVVLGMLVLCSWIIFFILEMAINKKFKIFKKVRFLEWGICALVLIGVVALIETDVVGIEKKVPTASETAGVIVQASHEMVITDPGEIAQIIQAHQDIVDSKDEYESAYIHYETPGVPYDAQENACDYVAIEYVLTNGKTLERRYHIPTTTVYLENSTRAASLIRSLQEDTDSAIKSWLVTNYEEMDIIGGVLYRYDKIGDQAEVIIDKPEMEVIYQAMLKDIRENNTGRMFGDSLTMDEPYYINCHINFSGEMKNPPISTYDKMSVLRSSVDKTTANKEINGGIVVQETVETASYYYNTTNTGMYVVDGYFDLYTTCEHTINALIELGIIESVDELYIEESYIEEMY